jgi:hypothetical protein
MARTGQALEFGTCLGDECGVTDWAGSSPLAGVDQPIADANNAKGDAHAGGNQGDDAGDGAHCETPERVSGAEF